MKILYISRLFTGLEQVIVEEKWIPTGVPTIYKIIEELNERSELQLILNRKIGYYRNKHLKKTKIKLDRFKKPIIVYDYIQFNFSPSFFNKLLTEIYQSFLHIYQFLKIRPDIVYIDNSNIVSAAILSRVSNVPVIFRVMGVYPVMKNYLKKNNLISKLYLKLYNSPFNTVIGTEDGSGTKEWMKRVINKKSNQHTLINGVKKEKLNLFSNKNKKFKICFIGKLEKAKGADVFFSSALKFISDSKNVQFIMVGSGSLYNGISHEIQQKKLENEFKLIRHLEHNDIYKLLDEIDLYVSLNKYGSLSNVNLEAISMNKAMVILNSDKKTETDLFVDKFIPKNAVIRIDRDNIENELISVFHEIMNDNKLIDKLKNNIKYVSSKLESWEDRINKEINIILKAYERKT